MIGSVDHDFGLFTRPLYTYAEADRLAGVSRGTSRRWVKGYHYLNPYGERVSQSSMTTRPEAEQEQGVSFFDLSTIKAIDSLREIGLSTRKIREAIRYCQDELQMNYPFATQKFKFDKHSIYVSAGEGYLWEVLGGQQGAWAWDAILDPFLDSLDYQNDLAWRWWPLGRDEPIFVDPEYGFGSPVIFGSGLRTELVAERRDAGDPPNIIAYDFSLTPKQIESALRMEDLLAA